MPTEKKPEPKATEQKPPKTWPKGLKYIPPGKDELVERGL